jgi:hypothetical protein
MQFREAAVEAGKRYASRGDFPTTNVVFMVLMGLNPFESEKFHKIIFVVADKWLTSPATKDKQLLPSKVGRFETAFVSFSEFCREHFGSE